MLGGLHNSQAALRTTGQGFRLGLLEKGNEFASVWSARAAFCFPLWVDEYQQDPAMYTRRKAVIT